MSRLTKDDLNKVCSDPWEICGMDKHCTKGCHEEGGCTGGCHILKMYRKLAKYEDLEEQCVKDNLFGLHELCEKWKAFFEDIVELVDYRKKQKQGLLISLPCKVGDTVYFVQHFMVESRKKPIKCTVNEFLIEGSGRCHAVLDGAEAFYEMKRFRAMKIEEFGKTVFLTQAEAEEALAKMGGNS